MSIAVSDVSGLFSVPEELVLPGGKIPNDALVDM